MDPQTDLPDLVEDLEVNIDELLHTLTPLLPPHTLSKTASSLPLLEKAKLHTLTAYAIESVLFSALQASGADAKAHPLFAELSRLKGYFAKIKHAEDFLKREEEREGRARLDVEAAGRFIRHGLSGNERYDELRRQKMEGEKARALEKARRLNKKFDDEEGEAHVEEGMEKTRVGGQESGTGSGSEGEAEAEVVVDKEGAKARKGKRSAENKRDGDDGEAEAPAKKKRGRPSKKDKAGAETATPQKDTPSRATRSTAPKSRSEAFQALAAGSPATKTKGKGKGKGKGKQ